MLVLLLPTVKAFEPKTTLPPVAPLANEPIAAPVVTALISNVVPATFASVNAVVLDKAPLPLNANVPALIVVAPVYVFALVKVKVPVPCFVKAPVPLMTPA